MAPTLLTASNWSDGILRIDCRRPIKDATAATWTRVRTHASVIVRMCRAQHIGELGHHVRVAGIGHECIELLHDVQSMG
jgi:hypothetical protein